MYETGSIRNSVRATRGDNCRRVAIDPSRERYTREGSLGAPRREVDRLLIENAALYTIFGSAPTYVPCAFDGHGPVIRKR